MTFALHVYRVLTSALSPFLGFVLSARVKQGKEDFSRRNERMARPLPVLRNNGGEGKGKVRTIGKWQLNTK